MLCGSIDGKCCQAKKGEGGGNASQAHLLRYIPSGQPQTVHLQASRYAATTGAAFHVSLELVDCVPQLSCAKAAGKQRHLA